MKLDGEEHEQTLLAACNCAASLNRLERRKEARALLRKMVPMARRILGDDDNFTLRMEGQYADALSRDDRAVGAWTLANLREAVTTLEDITRRARRVFGSSHPTTVESVRALQKARARLRVRQISYGASIFCFAAAMVLMRLGKL